MSRELAPQARRQAVSDVVKEGQAVKVKLLGFDDRGKVRLSMKQVDQATGEDLTKKQGRSPGGSAVKPRSPDCDSNATAAREAKASRAVLFCANGCKPRIGVLVRMLAKIACRRSYWSCMFVLMRLVSLVLIVAALMLLGADAVTSLEKGGEITVRSLDAGLALVRQARQPGRVSRTGSQHHVWPALSCRRCRLGDDACWRLPASGRADRAVLRACVAALSSFGRRDVAGSQLTRVKAQRFAPGTHSTSPCRRRWRSAPSRTDDRTAG